MRGLTTSQFLRRSPLFLRLNRRCRRIQQPHGLHAQVINALVMLQIFEQLHALHPEGQLRKLVRLETEPIVELPSKVASRQVQLLISRRSIDTFQGCKLQLLVSVIRSNSYGHMAAVHLKGTKMLTVPPGIGTIVSMTNWYRYLIFHHRGDKN